jgi:prolyl-tRNA synthetase
MLQSQLFTKTLKTSPEDEKSINADLLIRAGYIDKLMAGVYTFLPLGLLTLKKIEKIIREEMLNLGALEILMPVLQPKNNWQKTSRWDNLDTLFKFTSFYSKTDLVLGPTHEEVVSPLMKKFVFSYRDLPQAVFQIQTKFRDEKRPKSGLLRTREFLMKDLYSFHKDEDDLNSYYEKAKEAYFKIYKRFGLSEITYLTYASGGTFSKYSHEFQTLIKEGEDTIFICDNCRVALNKEIATSKPTCPQCGNKNLRKEKASEIGNIFKLKDKYSLPFNLIYKDKTGEEKNVLMGCYGIGLGRIMGVVVEAFNDKDGIIWPLNIAPFQIHLLSLTQNNKAAQKIYNLLLKNNFEVLFDDRTSATFAEKIKDADLIGIPYRLIISDKTLLKNQIEIKKRNSKKIKLIDQNKLVNFLKKEINLS